MSKTEKLNEEQIFKQELDNDELEAVSSGASGTGDPNNCVNAHKREIYKGGFPNCAATVENGSYCTIKNDACLYTAVRYKGMTDCTKAWR